MSEHFSHAKISSATSVSGNPALRELEEKNLYKTNRIYQTPSKHYAFHNM